MTIAALGEPKAKSNRYIVKKGDHGIGWKIYDKQSKKEVNWFHYKYDANDAAKEYNAHGYKPGHKIRKAKTTKRAAKKTTKRAPSKMTPPKKLGPKPSAKAIAKKRTAKKTRAKR